MRKTISNLAAALCVLSLLGAVLSATGCGSGASGSSTTPVGTSASNSAASAAPQAPVAGLPYYYLAVHNEPYNNPAGSNQIEQAYSVAREMVARANSYNIKLTLMFSAQWADYIAASPERLAEVRSWQSAGHEISAHHHGVWHGSWDGYSSYSQADAEAIRAQQGHVPAEPYHGTLDDYIAHLRQLDPDVKSGCLNEEPDKREMPDQILYGTGSGLANHGTPGVREGDNVPEKGVNEFVTVGTVNGIERRWLAHYQIYQDEPAAERVIASMSAGAFGGVVHSVEQQAQALYALMEYLHERDPRGANSRTLTGFLEGGLLGEQRVADGVINATNIRPGNQKGRKPKGAPGQGQQYP